MTPKPTLAILCGGPSPEHQISLLSARNVVRAAQAHFRVLVIGITRQGEWRLVPEDDFLVHADAASDVALKLSDSRSVWLTQKNDPPGLLVEGGAFFSLLAVFPVLHGAYGEDGIVQGLLERHGIPYVGCGVGASALCMDKAVTKRLVAAAGVPVAPGVCLEAHDWEYHDLEEITAELGFPLFVKPARLGSSIGVQRILRPEDLREALAKTFELDTKALVEAQIDGREIECAVIGNANPETALPGEVVPKHGFYSYQAKYDESDGAEVVVPARLSPTLHLRVQVLARHVYGLLGCTGLARVDLFLTRDERLIVNEVNTLPGFTDISLFPRLWAHSGVPLPDLVCRLVKLALERHSETQKRLEVLLSSNAPLKESIHGHR